MLYMICSCGEILGNKQLIYEQEMQNVCKSEGLDYNLISQGDVEYTTEFIEVRKKIVNELCRRSCCKQNLITYVDKVKMII